MKRLAIIIDLDGTLCDTKHRQHFVEQHPKDWEAFYGGIEHDKPNWWCKDLVVAMSDYADIIYVSGRPDNYRKQTVAWLTKYMPSPEFHDTHLFMRKAGDFRKDSIVKTEIYREHIEPNFDIRFCIDDRQQVVDAWRELGLVCLQCAVGDF